MSNPALNDNIFERETRASNQGGFAPSWGRPSDEMPPGLFQGQGQQAAGFGVGMPQTTGGPVGTDTDTMRVGGTVSATGVLLAILVVAGWFGWQSVSVTTFTDAAGETVVTDMNVPAWLIGAWIGGLVLAIVTVFKPKIARFTGPAYSVAQGLLVGAISHLYEVQYDGIVLQAVGLTVAVFAVMLVLFASGAIKVTDRVRNMIIGATMGVMLVYLASMLLNLFGAELPFIHDAGPMGILVSLVIVAIASFNLLLDFDLVQRGVAMKAPRYMEWFAAFGLMVTLIWLYLEMLRLLSKLRER